MKGYVVSIDNSIVLNTNLDPKHSFKFAIISHGFQIVSQFTSMQFHRKKNGSLSKEGNEN